MKFSIERNWMPSGMQVQAVLEAISTALDAGLPVYLHKVDDEIISAIAGC